MTVRERFEYLVKVQELFGEYDDPWETVDEFKERVAYKLKRMPNGIYYDVEVSAQWDKFREGVAESEPESEAAEPELNLRVHGNYAIQSSVVLVKALGERLGRQLTGWEQGFVAGMQNHAKWVDDKQVVWIESLGRDELLFDYLLRSLTMLPWNAEG